MISPRATFSGLSRGFAGADGRKRGRLRVSGVKCPYGNVADLSASGMRLRTKKRPDFTVDDTTEVVILAEERGIKVPARVVWVKRVGLRSWEVGLEFLETTESERKILLEIVRIGGAGIGFE